MIVTGPEKYTQDPEAWGSVAGRGVAAARTLECLRYSILD